MKTLHDEILAKLASMASPAYKKNIIQLGIPQQQCLGVPTPILRRYAKTLSKEETLANSLWNSEIHEARLLAVLLMDPKKMHIDDMEAMMSSVISWDLCDHICKVLAFYIEDYAVLIERWCDDERVYCKRAAYSLIATAMIHDKHVSEEQIHQYLMMIFHFSNDSRLHVKKAILWALREIGKKDENMQERALLCAFQLQETKQRPQVWIGKQAQKELESCVRVKGRSRLISNTSQMAKEVQK